MRSSLLPILVVVLAIVCSCGRSKAQIIDAAWKGFSVSCPSEEDRVANASVACQGVRLVRKIVQKMLEDVRRNRSLEILDGVSLVETGGDGGSSSRSARVLKDFGQIGSVLGFLENRELRIKLSSLMPDNLEAAVNASLVLADQGRGNKGGGGKKGDNGMMMLVLMMGKMMAAMGFGALGLMAMKALLLSSIALMLSLIVAAKKLVSKDEESHHVVYAQEHHRRRRSLPLSQDDLKNEPYRGYLSSARMSKLL
ncbi:uncharacterized protein LOC106642521 [Copidosoma floridanum]|uniref:uncharacterized protein LOC106642521 n=1 Tax=Copidosoma floridanum TaxID=29053 RepID=UPI0006C976D4|nr:uncharacterized protein LOC106642521 [Copidosoma floridanum]